MSLQNNPYYDAYCTVTLEDDRTDHDYVVWIRSKWEAWRKETGHYGGLEDKDREDFQKWLIQKKDGE